MWVGEPLDDEGHQPVAGWLWPDRESPAKRRAVRQVAAAVDDGAGVVAALLRRFNTLFDVIDGDRPRDEARLGHGLKPKGQPSR